MDEAEDMDIISDGTCIVKIDEDRVFYKMISSYHLNARGLKRNTKDSLPELPNRKNSLKKLRS